MSGHTKGPWRVTGYLYQEDGSAPTGRRAIIVSADSSGIADGYLIAGANGGVAEVKRGGKIAVADALLIASAPDLLAFVEAVIAKARRGETFADAALIMTGVDLLASATGADLIGPHTGCDDPALDIEGPGGRTLREEMEGK